MMRETDVAIIGAGPAGCVCAYLLKRAGVDCLIVDFASFPREKICGGGLTPKAYELLQELMPNLHYDYHGTRYFTLMMDGKRLCEVELEKELRMVHRKEFDKALLDQYTAIGGNLVKDTFSHFEKRQDGKILVSLKSGDTIVCNHLVAADGANSRVRRQMTRERRKTTLWMEQYVEKGANEFIFEFSRRYKKGYFFSVPGIDHHTVGMGGFYRSPQEIRQELCCNKIRLINSSNASPLRGANIPVDTTRSKIKNIILIGDAGGFANKLTYEGLYYAFVTGQNASKAILNGKSFDTVNHNIFLNKRKEVIITRLVYSRLGLWLMRVGARRPSLIKKAFEMHY